MARFRDVKTLQKFAAAHASIHNYFNQDRHFNRRDFFKQNRAFGYVGMGGQNLLHRARGQTVPGDLAFRPPIDAIRPVQLSGSA